MTIHHLDAGVHFERSFRIWSKKKCYIIIWHNLQFCSIEISTWSHKHDPEILVTSAWPLRLTILWHHQEEPSVSKGAVPGELTGWAGAAGKEQVGNTSASLGSFSSSFPLGYQWIMTLKVNQRIDPGTGTRSSLQNILQINYYNIP